MNAQVYLTRLEDFHAFDLAWSRTFPAPPPRTTVQAEALPSPDARVLVQLTAAAGELEVVDVITDEAPSPIANYTQARRADGLLFAAGQLASDFVTGVPPEASIDPAFPFYGTTIEAQTRYVLDNIDAVLRAGGSGLAHVVKALVLLRDLDGLSGLERVWHERFGDDPPARTSIELGGHGLLVRDARVEIYVIAATR